MNKLLLIIISFTCLLLISCNEDSDEILNDELFNGSVEIVYIDVIDTSTVTLQFELINSDNYELDKVGYLLYDNEMSFKDSLIIMEDTYNNKITFNVRNLDRAGTYSIRPFLVDSKNRCYKFESYVIKTHSFIISGFDHQNSDETSTIMEGEDEYIIYAGVKPTEFIYLKGDKLLDFNDNCEIKLEYASNNAIPFSIEFITDDLIALSIDKEYNDIAQMPYESFSITVLENNDTVKYYSNEGLLSVFTDRPFITSSSIIESGKLKIGGSFGNSYSDSIFIDDQKYYANGRFYREKWYHQTSSLFIDEDQLVSVSPGMHTIKVYLNGYMDSTDCEFR